jgi:hypothetical protein
VSREHFAVGFSLKSTKKIYFKTVDWEREINLYETTVVIIIIMGLQ